MSSELYYMDDSHNCVCLEDIPNGMIPQDIRIQGMDFKGEDIAYDMGFELAVGRKG